MNLTRRGFLAGSALAGVSAALSNPVSIRAAAPEAARKVRLAISTYSYWHFRPPKVSIQEVIDQCSALGVQGVDILHRQMDLPEKEPLDASGRAYLRQLKRHAFINGIDIISLSTHQTFATPKPEEITQ